MRTSPLPGPDAGVFALIQEMAAAADGSPSDLLPRSSAAYLAANPDVGASGIGAVEHWLAFGRAEGRPWPVGAQGGRSYRVLKAKELTRRVDVAEMVATPGTHAVFAPPAVTPLTPPRVVAEQDWHFCGPLHIRAFADFEERQFPEEVRSPAMTIAHLGATCLPGQVVISDDGVLLAESFNFWTEWGTHHHVKWRHGELPSVNAYAEPHQLEGNYLYLDNQHDSHYGHYLADVLSQAWAYEALTIAGVENLQVLVTPAQRDFMTKLFEAIGIPADRLVPVSFQVRVEHLFVSTKSFQVQGWTSPTAKDMWLKIANRLGEKGGGVPKLFVSRSKNGNRGVAQSLAIDELFASRGFMVLYPEEVAVADQVALFSNSPVVAGLSGSNMFNLAFGRGAQKVFIVCSPNLVHFSEQMLMGERSVDWMLYLGHAETRATHAPWSLDMSSLTAALDDWLQTAV